jgi:hypothetical protein
MKLVRVMLILSVLLGGYTAVLLAVHIKFLWIAYVIVLIACFCKKGHQTLTSHGTARWASVSDLKKKEMIE